MTVYPQFFTNYYLLCPFATLLLLMFPLRLLPLPLPLFQVLFLFLSFPLSPLRHLTLSQLLILNIQFQRAPILQPVPQINKCVIGLPNSPNINIHGSWLSLQPCHHLWIISYFCKVPSIVRMKNDLETKTSMSSVL